MSDLRDKIAEIVRDWAENDEPDARVAADSILALIEARIEDYLDDIVRVGEMRDEVAITRLQVALFEPRIADLNAGEKVIIEGHPNPGDNHFTAIGRVSPRQ